jgi:hypothetical protein
MAGPATLKDAIDGADSRLTVLDDKVDAEDHAAYLWMRAHIIPGYPHHRVVIGTDVLPPAWAALTEKFARVQDADAYLQHFVKNHLAMAALQKVAKIVSPPQAGALTQKDMLANIAAALANGKAWVLELPKRDLKSRFVGKTNPTAFAPINPKYGTKVDFTFIASLEGDQWLRGYVPISKAGVVIGASGMTVASGFDLGQWHSSDMKDFGFPAPLLKKLTPFAKPHNFKGLTKAKVAAEVGKLGPVPELTKPEADMCDGAVFSQILSDAMGAWDRNREKGVPVFTQLPAGWQTVWLSRVYQEGPRANPQHPNRVKFRNEALAGKWQDAIDTLKAYGEYTSRTKAEANLLAAKLPDPVTPPKTPVKAPAK